MQIKSVSLCVIRVNIHFIGITFVDGLIHKCFTVAVSLLFGQYEQHFQHIIA